MWAALAPLLFAAQISAQVPGVTTPRQRLPVAEAELFAIAQGEHDRRDVKTRGVLAPLTAPYLLLEQGTVRVMVIPMPGAESVLAGLVGRSVEITGFVRRLYERQGTCLADGSPQSYCDDPDLPPTPDRGGRPQWPTVSITAWSAFDAERGEGSGPGAEHSLLGDIVAEEPPPVSPVTVRGQFCGVSLCGSPATPAPERGAWRIADGNFSIWVIGREPRGKGWRLDPGYAGDASRWLEVTGKVVACGAARCLRASKVVLAPAPRPSDER